MGNGAAMTDEEALESLIGKKITGLAALDYQGDGCIVFVLDDGRQILFPCDTLCIETTHKWRMN